MSVSGAGRGRGWLKLKGNEDLPKPNSSPLVRPILSEYSVEWGDEETKVPAQFTNLIAQINKLDRADDGIMFNRKLASILQAWNKCCINKEDVR